MPVSLQKFDGYRSALLKHLETKYQTEEDKFEDVQVLRDASYGHRLLRDAFLSMRSVTFGTISLAECMTELALIRDKIEEKLEQFE